MVQTVSKTVCVNMKTQRNAVQLLVNVTVKQVGKEVDAPQVSSQFAL